MEDKKTAQYEQLIDDLREARRVTGDAKMKLHDLIDRINTAHDIGSMSDGVYEQMDTLAVLYVLYDNARLARVVLNQLIDALQEDMGSDENE